MPRQVFSFEPPERFVAGTVGQPGDRTFYLQATGAGRTVSVALEKIQVAALAERLTELLDAAAHQLGLTLPEAAPELEDNAPLDTPVEEEFRVGTLALAFDVDTSTVLVEARSATADELNDLAEDLDEALTEEPGETGPDAPEPASEAVAELVNELADQLAKAEEQVDPQPDPDVDDDDSGTDVLRVRLTPAAVRAFVARAERVLAAGRPPCPFCGLPLDASGHICPRQNGFRR